MKRATLLLFAACGTSDPDIPQPDGPFVPGPVSIAITQRGAPAVNVPVFFQNADSSVAVSTVTDFDGRANGEVDGAGYVTVIEPREGTTPRQILSTFAGVQGGDELHLDLAPKGPTDVTDLSLQLQEDLGVPQAVGYLVFTECGPLEPVSFTAPTPAKLIGCGDTSDFLIVTLDENNEPLRSQLRQDVSLAAPQNFNDSQLAYTPFNSAMLSYRNIPGEVGFVGVNRAFANDRQIMFDLNAAIFPDAADVAIKVPAASGAIAIAASSLFPTAGELGSQVVIDWEPATGGDYTLDIGAAMLPRYIEPPVYSATRRTATWTEAAGNTEPDAVRIHLQIHRPEVPAGTAWEWRLVGPRAGASVTFPRIPIDESSGFDFNPISKDTISVHELTTVKLPAGYDKAARERGFIPFKDLRTGTSGRIVTQDLFEGDPPGEPEL